MNKDITIISEDKRIRPKNSEVSRLFGDNTKLKKFTNWQPKFSGLDGFKKGLELNGTITGEHGVGLHKKKYLLEQHADNMPVMKSIKRTLDSNNIMNPGKIFDLN